MGAFLFAAGYNLVCYCIREGPLQTPVSSLVVQPWFERLRIVLVRARNPLNIGAAARAISNFGFTHLRLVTPWEPSYHDARSAVGASEVLLHSEVYASVAEAVADCNLVVGTTAVGARELHHPVHVLEQGAELMRQELARGPVALLFGSEKFGLSNEDMSHCHWLMRIPTRDQHISMNLGQAVAVCAYELARSSSMASAPDVRVMAEAAEIERLTQVLFESLRNSGYVLEPGEAVALEKVRRLLRRMTIEKADAEVWLGMMRQILWKTGQGRKD